MSESDSDSYSDSDSNHLPDTIREMYENVKTYSDLLDLNIKYLTSKIDMKPGSLGPICEETFPLVERLVKINHYGFLTNNSQPSLCVHNEPCKTSFISYEQKGYIYGMIASKYIEKLRTFLLEHAQNIEWTIETKDEIINSTKRHKTNLTRSVNSVTKLSKSELEKSNTWKYCTNHWCPGPQSSIGNLTDEIYAHYRHYPAIIDMFNNECSYLFLCNKIYGSDVSVFDLLLTFFESKS